jgi:DNA helicase-4
LVGQMVERKGPKNSTFFGCNRFPECRHTRQAGAEPAKI